MENVFPKGKVLENVFPTERGYEASLTAVARESIGAADRADVVQRGRRVKIADTRQQCCPATMERAERLKCRATNEDLLDVPDHLVAEIVDGELFTTPRPALRHAHASSALEEANVSRASYKLNRRSVWLGKDSADHLVGHRKFIRPSPAVLGKADRFAG